MRTQRARAHGWVLLVLAVEAALALAAVLAVVPVTGLLLAPLLAARRLTVRSSIATAATATALAIALPAIDPTKPSAITARVAGALIVAVGSGLAVLTAHAHARNHRSLARMTRIAEVAQLAITPPLPPRLGGLDLAVRTLSATDRALLGGDLHDAIAIPAGARIILGDVKGHGIEAVPMAVVVLSAFRQVAATEPDLTRLALAIDARISPELGDEDFVTLLLADFVDGEVHLVNCGHPPPLHIARRMTILEPPQASPPLGLSPAPYLDRVQLGPGHRLLLHTDGLTEATDPHGGSFPFNKQLHTALTTPDPNHALDQVVDLVGFTDRRESQIASDLR